MEGWGGVVRVLGKGMYLLAASQKTRKINTFEGANRNCCRPRSISPQFWYLPPALSLPFMIIDIHFTCKSIKVFLSKPSNPFLIMSMIVPINICSRGASVGRRGGGSWGESGRGQWPLMIICSLLKHPAKAFISRRSGRDPTKQPLQ